MNIGTRTSDQIAFDEAWLYIACLYEQGYSDWRFPTSQNRRTYGLYWCWSADTVPLPFSDSFYNHTKHVYPVRG